jgi:uroporphyrinogen-III synthase
VVAVIGPVTADAAAQLGFTVTVQPATFTVPAMVEAIVAHFRAAPMATA